MGNHHSTSQRPPKSLRLTGLPSWSGSVNAGARSPSDSLATAPMLGVVSLCLTQVIVKVPSLVSPTAGDDPLTVTRIW